MKFLYRSSFLFIFSFLMCHCNSNDTSDQEKKGEDNKQIVDLALIYQGGVKRLDWNKEQIAPHVSWVNPETNKEEWLFDGFLFIEFRDFQGHIFATGYGDAPAPKHIWTWLLERVFEKNLAVDALNQVVGETISRVGEPKRKHKVVLTLPEPIYGFKGWGELNGKKLDFEIAEDRIAATKWFVDELIVRWEKENFKNLELAGFYWVAEETDEKVTPVIQQTAQYISEKGKEFYWIPWWNSPGSNKWADLGFNVAWQQPNHFFNTSVPDSRLSQACEFALARNMGMEIEWDEKLWTDSDNYIPRLQAYMNTFEHFKVADTVSMAHYMGWGGLYDFKREKEGNDRLTKLYNRYCTMISSRQINGINNKD